MLRRPPTRIELQIGDKLEWESQKVEILKKKGIDVKIEPPTEQTALDKRIGYAPDKMQN